MQEGSTGGTVIGTIGRTGAAGTTGIAGTTGTAGTDGPHGRDGPHGTDGTVVGGAGVETVVGMMTGPHKSG